MIGLTDCLIKKRVAAKNKAVAHKRNASGCMAGCGQNFQFFLAEFDQIAFLGELINFGRGIGGNTSKILSGSGGTF